MLYLLVIALLALMLLFPGTPASRLLHRALVEPSARWVSRLKPGTTVFWLILFVAIAAVLLDARELLFGLAGIGEAAPFIAMLVDGSITVELMMAIWFATASGALKSIMRLLRGCLLFVPRLVRRAATFTARRSSRRSRRKRQPSQPPKRDDTKDHPAVWLPAAA